jgi:hypothetical protein
VASDETAFAQPTASPTLAAVAANAASAKTIESAQAQVGIWRFMRDLSFSAHPQQQPVTGIRTPHAIYAADEASTAGTF